MTAPEFELSALGRTLREIDLQLFYSADDARLPALYRAIQIVAARFDLLLPSSTRGAITLSAVLPFIGRCPLRVLIYADEENATLQPEVTQLLAAAQALGAPSASVGVAANAAPEDPHRGVLVVTDTSDPEESVAFSVPLSGDPRITALWSWGDPQHRIARLKENFESRWVGRQQPKQMEQPVPASKSGPTLPPLLKHQEEAVQEWRKNSFNGIFHMCTGAGKTIAALAAAQSIAGDSTTKKAPSIVVVLCPTIVLVDQWAKEMRVHGIPVNAIVYDNPAQYLQQLDVCLTSKNTRYVVGTYHSFCHVRFQALIRRAESQGYLGMLIADEMHSCTSPERRRYLREAGRFFHWRLGLTATPEIENDPDAERELRRYFGDVAGRPYELEDALRDGVLCPYVYRPRPVFLDPELSREYLSVLQKFSSPGSATLAAYAERRRILGRAELAVSAIESICTDIENAGASFSHTLIFCPPGSDYLSSASDDEEEQAQHDDLQPIIAQVKRCFQDRHVRCDSILANTTDRSRVLSDFASGAAQVLLAIGCLDEGMDVPSTTRAIMLYSVDRRRQFIQRRGRVLRKHRNKTIAEIMDIIVLPQNADISPAVATDLLRRELRRFTEFARLATNREEASFIIEQAIKASAERTRL